MLGKTPHGNLFLPVATALILVFSGAANAAVINSYSSLSGWTAAAGTPVVVEDFSDASLVPGFSVFQGSIGAGVFSGQAMPGVFPESSRTSFSFAPGTLAFGADWDLSPGGPGSGIGFTLTFSDASTQDYFGITNPATGGTFNGFFGLVSDTAISSISLYTGSFTGNSELFDMDNARFVGEEGTSVPEPASLALLGLGLVGVGFSRRKKV